jgi:hypothetical protein
MDVAIGLPNAVPDTDLEQVELLASAAALRELSSS